MLEPKDLLPQPPWNGPPVPRGGRSPEEKKERRLELLRRVIEGGGLVRHSDPEWQARYGPGRITGYSEHGWTADVYFPLHGTIGMEIGELEVRLTEGWVSLSNLLKRKELPEVE